MLKYSHFERMREIYIKIRHRFIRFAHENATLSSPFSRNDEREEGEMTME